VPRKTLTVRVNPRVLVWARESAGVTVAELAKRVRTSVETVRHKCCYESLSTAHESPSSNMDRKDSDS